ncbi:MAG: ABC transporter ATP-binding protein/permease [Marinilabiliaceae bacterium]|nr:ABC transporter ATP-binding protein/permease [Marinilabiliaceae bacterium]
MKKLFSSSHLKYFLFYWRRLKWRIPILLALSAIVAFLDGIGLALFVPVFQVAESTGASDMGANADALGKLAFIVDFFDAAGIELSIGNLMILMLALFGSKALLGYGSRLYATKIRVNFMKETRIQLIEGICNVSYPGFVNIDNGRMQNVITAEIGKAVGAFTSFLTAMQYIITLVGYMALAFMTNFQFALLITVAGLLSNFIFKIINRKVETASLWQSLISNGLQGKILEAVFNFKYLKATDLISNYRKKLVDLTIDAENLSYKMGKFSAISTSIREPILMLFVCSIIYVQVTFMDASIMGIALSLMLFMRSLNSLLSVQTNWQAFLSSSGGVRTVDSLYLEFEQNIESKEYEDVDDFKESIDFENVTFYYAPHLPIVLNDITLSIKKNQTIAFVGESGSGKTTLVNMLTGLFSPVSGTIKIDDIPLTAKRFKGFRNYIGYITQEPVVFNDTIFNNISFHEEKNEGTLNKFVKILEKTALTAMVENLPEREDALLGDNGVLISGGQKQRVSIARELYRDCSLLLMDEATSALDTENELIIQTNINALKGKYTIVIIAHRLSTVKNADVIYLLDKGKIEAFGNFEVLKEKSPRFKKMVELQEFT